MGWRAFATAIGIVALVAVGAAAHAEDKPAAGEGAADEEKGFFGKLKDDVVEGAESLKQEAAAAVPDVPSGAVVAFNRDKCPVGWSEFPPAAGRVIRGAGDSGDGKTVQPMEIGEAGKAGRGDDVSTGVPWLGLLICEKD